ncbi:MAG: ABC-type multidrug transport system fused ATPase/permease subunit [Candidatus Marinamargulisbacteria bacterium]|jgi:ABC-type multidrug transport system fused ATPase/permease subunit
MNESLKMYAKFVRYIRPYWDKMTLSFTIDLVLQLGVLLPPLILRALFDYVYPNKDMALMAVLLGVPFILAILFQTLVVLKSFLDLYTSQQVFKSLYRVFYSKAQRLPMSFYHTHKPGDLIYRMTDDMQIVEETLLTTVPQLSVSLIKLVVLLILCFSLNVSLTLIALAGVPLYFIQNHLFSKKLKTIKGENQSLGSELFDHLQERLSNIKLIKSFHRWSTEVDHLIERVSRLFVNERKTRLTESMQTLLSTLVTRIWSLVIGLYTGYAIITGMLTIGEVVAITAYITMLKTPFQRMAGLYKRVMISSVSFKRISEILEQDEECGEDEDGKSLVLEGNIAFENVDFSYDSKTSVLKNISFDVQKGQSIGIVGRSGIGKTSIVDLLLRFFTVTGGKIQLDGVPINEISLATLRKQIGVITQDPCLFDGTIADNIRFGSELPVSDEVLIEVAKMADAYEFIMECPDGINTRIGPKGSRLSKGQCQRIAIARTLVSNPNIIVFDEATSALDGISEMQIYKTLLKFKGQKTVIVIAHRISAIKQLDRIVVLGNEGEIVEQGGFMELLQKKDVFYRLYEMQFGGYPQFMEQLAMLMKSVKRYDRPVSVGLIRIKNFKFLAQTMEVAELDSLLNDVGITTSLLLREADFCTYEGDGKWWILFQETAVKGAELSCQCLVNCLDEVSFTGANNEKVAFDWSARQCQRDENPQQVSERVLAKV